MWNSPAITNPVDLMQRVSALRWIILHKRVMGELATRALE
jgi:hypothetical protein